MILGRQSGLGRGLGAIIPPKSLATPTDPTQSVSRLGAAEDVRAIHEIPVHLIDSNPHQPREHFDHGAMEDLIASIREHGIMQPIILTQTSDGRYELIAGERRLRASKVAGLETIPSILRTATEQQKLEIAIIENVQRADLNPLEEARAYLRLQDEFNLTQEEIGGRVHKSRPQVANTIRLLSLPDDIQRALAEGKISPSHARTLLSLSTDEERMGLFQQLLASNFTVRQIETRVASRRRLRLTDPNLEAAEERLRDALGAKVLIKRDARGEGEIRVHFFNEEDLHALLKKIAP